MASDNADIAPETDPYDDPVLPNRTRAATSLRELGHALVGHHVEASLFDEIAETVDRWLPRLDGCPPRARPVDDMKKHLFEGPAGEGDLLDHFPDCVVSGQANPMGVAATFRREGDDAVARVTLGAAFEGAPKRAHGGIVAALFDDAMGMVLRIVATPAYTGELTVRYLAPTPVGVELEVRARLVRREGRKLWIESEAVAENATVATASGLFITIPPERFGLPSET